MAKSKRKRAPKTVLKYRGVPPCNLRWQKMTAFCHCCHCLSGISIVA